VCFARIAERTRRAFERARSFAGGQEFVIRAMVLKFEQIEPLGKWFAAVYGY